MRLEERLRQTLHAEAERFRPELAGSGTLAPQTSGPRWLLLAGSAAALAVMIGVTAVLYQAEPTVAPPETTTPPPVTTTPGPATTVPHVPPQLTPWVPEYFVENGIATLVVTFVDGSTAELTWPEELDLMSRGAYPYGWALIPHVAARDFFIRHGDVEDVVAQFGRPVVIDQYPDRRGGTVALWSPEGAGTNFLGFQFGPWVILVYEGGSQVLTPPMSREQRELWIRSFRGETTHGGFLRLYGDEPLRLVVAGEYPSPLSMTFESPGGQVELVPGECQPGVPGESISLGSGEFVDWCDSSGLMTIRIVGPSDFHHAVFEGLRIGAVRLVGIEGPDAHGSFAYMLDQLERARVRWEQADFKTAYRLTVTGHISTAAVDFTVTVRDGEVTIERGATWHLSDPLTVETLFDMVEEAIGRGDQVSVRFHPEHAYPVWIRSEGRPDVEDDEMGLVIQLEPLD